MKYYCIIYYGILLSLTPLKAQINSTSIIKGKVLEVETLKPVQGANVYLIGTMKGAVTNINGDYIIKNIPNSTFFVIASCIGYKSQKKKVSIKKGSFIKLDYLLDKEVYDLEEVTIVDDMADEWRNNYKTFKEQFIGQLETSEFTEILNPYIINFKTTDDDWLSAEAAEPILIKNNTLGYNIKYYLESFLYQFPIVKYSGQPFFKEIKINDDIKDTEIKKSRIEAYCGSLRHFLYVAAKQYIQDSIKKNIFTHDEKDDEVNWLLKKHGFKVLTETSIGVDENIVTPIVYPLNMNDFFIFDSIKFQLYLTFPFKLKVEYSREYEDKLIHETYVKRKNKFRRKKQISWIFLPRGSVALDNTGYYFDSFDIQTFGHWAYERIANSLPYEFSLPDSILINYNLQNEP